MPPVSPCCLAGKYEGYCHSVKKFCSAIAAVVLAIITLWFAQPAAAFPVSMLTLNGHGFGHGRGMGQYGALGYAVDSSWSWQQILDHYYGGTSFGAQINNPTIGVRIMGFDGVDMIVTSANNFTVGSTPFTGGQAALVHRTASNAFSIQQAASCAGPWTQVATQTGLVTATPANGNPGNDENQMLRLCMSSGIRGVRGTATAVDDNGTIRTVNNLPVEDYLRGVIPRESPASWGDLGGGKGMNALRAQAVAARSYALAAASYSYATTCDSQACQVYGGAFLNGTYIEDARSNQAVADTAGYVRRFSNGNIARTEFSSSTGGYTAGGTFDAVADDGDAYSGNPHHNWTASINVSSVESSYPSIGSLQSIYVSTRNGLGDQGGRITKLIITGTNGSVETTGLDFRTKLGTKSDWFEIANAPSGGVNGYLMLANDGGIFAFGDAQFYGSMGGQHLNAPIKSFARTPTGKGYWEVASDGGIFAFGDAQFYGSMGGKPLNKPIVGMTATPSGKGYWFVASDGGIFSYGDAQFYGSTGSIPLRQPITGIAASANGYWMVASDGGIFAFGDAGFFGSLPGSKATATINGMARSIDGQGYMLVGTKGELFSYGSAPNFGDLASKVANFKGTVIGIITTS